MTDVWIDGLPVDHRCLLDRAADAGGPYQHLRREPFNGNDYWKLCTQVGFGWGQEYSEAIKAQGQKAIFDLWRSFVETASVAGGSRAGRPPARTACSSITAGSATTTGRRQPTTNPGGSPCTARAA